MMKIRVLYLFAVVCTALAACRKGEGDRQQAVLSDDPIRFGTPSIKVSRSELNVRAAGPVNEFPSGGDFGVLGYCLANYDGSTELNPTTGPTPWASKAVLCSPHVFYKQQVKYNGTACYYTGTQQRWYEASDYLYTFLAYSPYGDAYYTVEPTTQTGIGLPSLTFSMPFSGGDLSTLRPIDQIPDAMAAAAVDVSRQDGKVDLSFEHLLAGFNFKVNNYNPTNDLTIHGLRLVGNFYRSLKIRMNQGLEFPSEMFAGTFTFLDGGDDADDVTVGHDKMAERVGGETLMLVSNLGASPDYLGTGIEIQIDYSFMGVRTTGKAFALPGGYLPQGGTIYTIEMNFIGDAFVLNFVVDNNQMWEEGGDSDIKFE